MAHDPVNPDLQYPPFSQWLSLAIRHISNPTSKKIGLKLDFKDFSAVEPCLKELLNHNVLLSHNIPIWINADILQGPHGRQAAIDAFAFVQLCKDYGFVTMPACTLSLGWTTGAPKGEQDVYTDAMVGEMARVCEHFELKRITFPVRAYFVQPSVHSLEFLLNKCKNSTLTVWNTFTEPVDKKLFEWLSGSFKQRKWINLFLATFGKNTFLDVKFADDV